MSERLEELLEALVEEIKGLREDFASASGSTYDLDDIHRGIEGLGNTIETQFAYLMNAGPGQAGTDLADVERTLRNIESGIDGLER